MIDDGIKELKPLVIQLVRLVGEEWNVDLGGRSDMCGRKGKLADSPDHEDADFEPTKLMLQGKSCKSRTPANQGTRRREEKIGGRNAFEGAGKSLC